MHLSSVKEFATSAGDESLSSGEDHAQASKVDPADAQLFLLLREMVGIDLRSLLLATT
jgi:hypothetical protein